MIADSRQDNTRRAFDDAATDFTALGRHLWDPIGAATAAAAQLGPGDRVMDACCGAGASAIPAAGLVGADGVVDAVDLSGPMVGELRRLSSDLPQLHATQADVTTWDTAGYDAVLCALGIFFFPDMTEGTRHLISRTRPGGRVVFTIWRGDAMAAAGRCLGHAVAAVTDAAPPQEREPHLFDRINKADTYLAWLTELGLTDVDVATHELRLPLTPDLAWLVITGSGYRGALGNLEPDVVEDVRKRYLDSLHAEGITEFDGTTLIGIGLSPRHAR
ncbi:SAM-dependent methyltransferase [Actinophytocola xinjiangensis]|uniref:SAM-dependent methyltransferase n=1 Tax=Actinophytocola xinjiangensis TaxID=485602 RepID=A0A7Z0WLX6_9PSEU|nr:class I SAM-dependent methyltransferase [Actinophytocola xinjiangensis]OLF10555.1 SAM-dependent methyltransferase [Actinophytocola xinjiangensis]